MGWRDIQLLIIKEGDSTGGLRRREKGLCRISELVIKTSELKRARLGVQTEARLFELECAAFQLNRN